MPWSPEPAEHLVFGSGPRGSRGFCRIFADALRDEVGTEGEKQTTSEQADCPRPFHGVASIGHPEFAVHRP